jgi:hypothetical protein
MQKEKLHAYILPSYKFMKARATAFIFLATQFSCGFGTYLFKHVTARDYRTCSVPNKKYALLCKEYKK